MSYQSYVIIKQHDLMRRFRKASALDAKTAKPLAELKIKPDRIFQKMQDKDIFRPGRTPETFYLDENAAGEFVEARRRRMFYLMLLALAAAGLGLLLGRR